MSEASLVVLTRTPPGEPEPGYTVTDDLRAAVRQARDLAGGNVTLARRIDGSKAPVPLAAVTAASPAVPVAALVVAVAGLVLVPR